VDADQGDVEEVYLNPVFICRLSGANSRWQASASTLELF